MNEKDTTDLEDQVASKNKKNFYAKTYKKLMNENQTERRFSEDLPKDWSQISATDLKHLPNYSKNYRPGPKISESSTKDSGSRSVDDEKKGKSRPK